MSFELALIDYSKYPFLKSLEDELKKYGSSITIKDLLITSKEKLDEARSRIENVMKEKFNVPYSQLHGDTVLTFYLSLLILSALGSKILTEKFVENEVNVFKSQLMMEKPDVVVEIAKILGINVNTDEIELREYQGKKIRSIRLPFAINFVEYLKYSKELRKRDEKFSLRKHVLQKGNVYLDKNELVDLITDRIRERIMNIIKQIQLTDVPEEIKKLADEIKGRKTPPCIMELMKKKESLTQEEKKILLTYIIDIGADSRDFAPEEIVKETKKTRVIVYSCERLKELGLCVNNCGVKNPLQLYYGKLL